MDGEKYTVWSIILSITLFIFYYKVKEGKINILGLRELQISKELVARAFQLKQQKKSQFSKTCYPMLSSGSYQNKTLFSSNHSNIDLISECSKSESCKANAWLPSLKCTWHKYSTEDARQCFKNKKIQVIGDSRGRQLYLGMKDRLEGKGWVYDVDGLFLGCKGHLIEIEKWCGINSYLKQNYIMLRGDIFWSICV